jgi:hypothetical protein
MDYLTDEDIQILEERESFLTLLWNDVLACNLRGGEPATEVQRRQFFRSMFACIEGAVWLFKQDCLQQHAGGHAVFSPPELCALSEVAPVIDGQGCIQELPVNLHFMPNLRFAFRCHARAFNYEPVLHAGDHEWGDLKESVKVRNRLMHPKQLSSMHVSDDEIRRAQGALEWFGLRCSAATLGVSMWHAGRALEAVEDPADRAARMQVLSVAAESLKRVVLER